MFFIAFIFSLFFVHFSWGISDQYVRTIHNVVVCNSDVEQMCLLFKNIFGVTDSDMINVHKKIRASILNMLNLYANSREVKYRDVRDFVISATGRDFDLILGSCANIGVSRKNALLFFAVFKNEIDSIRLLVRKAMSSINDIDSMIFLSLKDAGVLRVFVPLSSDATAHKSLIDKLMNLKSDPSRLLEQLRLQYDCRDHFIRDKSHSEAVSVDGGTLVYINQGVGFSSADLINLIALKIAVNSIYT
ncbi:hypothetical protein [Candidatus Gromoviella agglomerans]|uniref:hypothetical protein n=1 Tax=Candidatus Gromoviella agglomerans TaxID=2806609 RepID=UPI001E41B98C|nr:hypothetical protein [Candidatus Gromoviella agglomerans]UFX98541.1 hypothetical protein Gromo_00455 [Candidatus Gromoviella agglomerans]